MGEIEKTPLQVVVTAICDAVADLPSADQERALEASRVALGLDRVPRRMQLASMEQRPQLPMIQVQMMGGQPRVVSATDPPGSSSLVVVSRARRTQPALSGVAPIAPPRGYVRDVRARR